MRGGLRTRFIIDSVRLTAIAGLEALGWFDPTIHDTPPGARRHLPLHYIPRPAKWDQPIEPNSLAITSEGYSDDDSGLGGDVADRINLYADLYAQDDAFGWHLTRDLRDILLGKLPEIGCTGPVIDVYDFRQATPAPFTTVDVEEIIIDRAEGLARERHRNWFMTRIGIEDEHLDDSQYSSSWADLRDAWERIQAIELS
jgi:hypothetical protein